MKIETLQDILQWARGYHAQSESCLEHCAEVTEVERVKLLLSCLAEHEQRLARALECFERQADLGALNTWVAEYIDKKPVEPHKSCEAIFSDMTADQVIQQVLYQQKQIVSLYQHLEAYLPDGRAKQFLVGLIDLENHEAMQMSKHYQQLEDY